MSLWVVVKSKSYLKVICLLDYCSFDDLNLKSLHTRKRSSCKRGLKIYVILWEACRVQQRKNIGALINHFNRHIVLVSSSIQFFFLAKLKGNPSPPSNFPVLSFLSFSVLFSFFVSFLCQCLFGSLPVRILSSNFERYLGAGKLLHNTMCQVLTITCSHGWLSSRYLARKGTGFLWSVSGRNP